MFSQAESYNADGKDFGNFHILILCGNSGRLVFARGIYSSPGNCASSDAGMVLFVQILKKG